MFLITRPGERHEDHIPIILLRSKLDVERWIKHECEGTDREVRWDITDSNYPIVGYFEDEWNGVYEIFEISLGRPIPIT